MWSVGAIEGEVSLYYMVLFTFLLYDLPSEVIDICPKLPITATSPYLVSYIP
ncbi:hypothetical protein PORCRE_2135 [Porphyromonas crevioricanis JCM 15906]|uniref:Uncharacterized protein n=1 Tax=Porphyromonas crevioricanis JCM 15906 TaxID=1305617 RepID=T1CRC1_9PORP|nr:hypothetical protein PORCRE_2135 [Porphyromonas crevioricanis JCM 15906]